MLKQLLFLAVLLLPTALRAQFWAAMPPLQKDHNQDLSFSQDEKFVFYISNESGSANVFKVPVKGGPALQVTKFTDAPVYRAVHMLGRNYVLYMKAKSPNDTEYHIYRIKDDGNDQPLDLTPTGVGTQNTIIGESYNGKYVYYTANKESLTKLDCYRYDNEQNVSELVLPNDKDYRVIGWSRDQQKLLVEDPATTSASLFDIQTTNRDLLASPTGSNTISQALLSPDNHTLIVRTPDEKSLTTDVSSLPSAKVKTVTSSRDVHQDYSPNGKYVLIKKDGNWVVASAGDPERLSAPIDALPLPAVHDIAIAPKENLITFVVGDATSGMKLQLYNIEKKTTTDLAVIK